MVQQGKRERALQISEEARRRFKAPALTPQLVIYTDLELGKAALTLPL
jgi:hypothetical protein